MRRVVVLILNLCVFVSLSAQTVSNVVARQVGNTVEITYDLDKAAEVSLLFSRDGGANYNATAQSLTGDIDVVTAGHKKIVWDLFKDGTDWDVANARFKVVAKAKESELKFSINGVSFTMVLVEGGTFTMGGTSEQDKDYLRDEKPLHSVTLSDYYIGKTEVTNELWKAVMGTTPSYFSDDKRPVEYVSWKDCQTFIHTLNAQLADRLENERFALPTEAQWEYAARGGGFSPYKFSGSDNIFAVAWCVENSNSSTHPVATLAANKLGLYDMSGNVWEWCLDKYDSYVGTSQMDPSGPSSGNNHVCRGGSWSDFARHCRTSRRSFNEPSCHRNNLGLRLVLSIPTNNQ